MKSQLLARFRKSLFQKKINPKEIIKEFTELKNIGYEPHFKFY